ncbi:uncharacterized protein LOC112969010 [Apteryx rowi]|uniref:uncharacterized protein LOC112969010 n=1 Tax=Apteryx rowi TaxID=308060 RepID=UPI000E1E201A|nr:uncharacterized protein LOC112969010 [Apteryx rowi]
MADGGAEPGAARDPQPEGRRPGGRSRYPRTQDPAPGPGHGRTPLRPEDAAGRKRARLCPGARASPSRPRVPDSPREPPWPSPQPLVASVSATTASPGAGAEGWTPRGARLAGLYAELLRELEAQAAELRQALASRDEAAARRDRRLRELELENRQLKSHIRRLEEENDLLSAGAGPGAPATTAARTLLASGSSCIGVSDSNVQFLKGLVGLLESGAAAQVGGLQPFSGPLEQGCAPANVPRSPPARRLRAGLPGGFAPCLGTEEGAGSPAALTDTACLWEEGGRDTLPDGTPLWASPVEENGRPKLELVPNSGVYITHPQLDDLSQVSTDKPKLMTRRLLDYFFSRETLARSSATGQRIAHNNTTMERPLRLPVAVVNAIKEYVTKMCGRGCNFNAVINSKCGTSRRAVKKMGVKMD